MKRTSGILVLIAAAVLAGASPAGGVGSPIIVDDGSDCPNPDAATISGGVAIASPGDTIVVCPGTYTEQVNVTKNDLTIRAQGAPGDVMLRGAVHSPEFGFLLDNVSGVTVEGFDIRLFHEAGIRISRGGNNTLRQNVSAINSHDGIQLGSTSFNLAEHNVTFGNSPANPARACGIQLLDLVVSPFGPSNFNVIRNNTIFQEAFGIRLENGNGNVVFQNDASNNRRLGIWNRLGANNSVIEDNRAFDNVGTGIPPTEGRGIAVTGSTGVFVARNHAFGNTLDMFWDGAGLNTFENNHCNTSVPTGLCEHTEGNGDSGH